VRPAQSVRADCADSEWPKEWTLRMLAIETTSGHTTALRSPWAMLDVESQRAAGGARAMGADLHDLAHNTKCVGCTFRRHLAPTTGPDLQ
jgi:hypothetical protein